MVWVLPSLTCNLEEVRKEAVAVNWSSMEVFSSSMWMSLTLSEESSA